MRKNINTTNLTDTVQERMLKIELAMQFIAYDVCLVLQIPTAHCLAGASVFGTAGVYIANSLGMETSLCFGSESEDITPLIELAKIDKKKLDDEYNCLKLENNSKKLNSFFDHPGAFYVLNQDTALKDKSQKEYRDYLESQAEHIDEISLYIFKELKNEKFVPARFVDSEKFDNDENLFEKVTIKNAKILHIDGKDFDCIIIN